MTARPMVRRFLPLLVGLLLAIATATALMAAIEDPHKSARIWDVCPEGCPYTQIQGALNAAAGAASPETPSVVMVAPGTYRENLIIGSPGSTNAGNIKLMGFSRESVRIIAPDATQPAITVNGLASEIRDLTVISNNTLGQAITFSLTQENRGRVINVQAECPAQTIPIGCIWWNSSTAAGTLPRFELRDSTVRFGTFGVLMSIGGRVFTSNNSIETLDGLGLASAAFGYVWNPAAGPSETTWISDHEYIRMRKTTTGAGADVFGIDLNAQTAANSYIYGATIDVQDLGTGATGSVGGIGFTGTGSASALDRCFNCDILVARPNSTGAVRGGFNVNANASQVILYNGRYRTSNSAGTAVDLFQANAGILSQEGADFQTIGGVIAGGAGNGSDNKQFASMDFLELVLSSDLDNDGAAENVRVVINEDGSTLGLFGTTAAGGQFTNALAQALYHATFNNPYQIATGNPTPAARMTILGTGEIGIGTTTPSLGSALHVVGTTVVTKLFMVPLATAPATCGIGDFYVDTSGAYCGCTSTNTWTNFTAVGTCV